MQALELAHRRAHDHRRTPIPPSRCLALGGSGRHGTPYPTVSPFVTSILCILCVLPPKSYKFAPVPYRHSKSPLNEIKILCLPMRSQTSSSSESSRSGSPDTRATTPSSTLEKSYLPHNYVYLASTVLSLPTLSALFEMHASSGRMGLIVDNRPSPTFSTQDDWVKQPLPSHSVLEYYTSSTYLAPTLFVCQLGPIILATTQFLFYKANCPISTDPIQANHHHIFSLAGLRAIFSASVAESCTLHVLEKPSFAYLPLSHTISRSLAPSPEGTCGNIPTPEEWRTLWASWDFITLQMIPREMLHQKPIDLRHKCLFYIGHIPTYVVHMKCYNLDEIELIFFSLFKVSGYAHFEIDWWRAHRTQVLDIFERGIDPHVDDPDHCHVRNVISFNSVTSKDSHCFQNHSEVPEKDDDWPAIETINLFRDKVRTRLMCLYDDIATGKRVLTRNIARTLVMTYEHEGFHVEVNLLLSSIFLVIYALSLDPSVHVDSASRIWHLTPARLCSSSLGRPFQTMGFVPSPFDVRRPCWPRNCYTWPPGLGRR